MQKMRITLLAAALLAAPLALAAPGEGFHHNPPPPPPHVMAPAHHGVEFTTVRHAKTMRDDRHVALRGHIVRHLRGDHYLFRDATGEIEIEIDHDKWLGHKFSSRRAVEIFGEVDRDRMHTKIEVDRINFR